MLYGQDINNGQTSGGSGGSGSGGGGLDPSTRTLPAFALPEPGQGEVYYAAFDNTQDQNSDNHFMKDLSGNDYHPTNKPNMGNIPAEQPYLGRRGRQFKGNPFGWTQGPLLSALSGDVTVDFLYLGIRSFSNDNNILRLFQNGASATQNRLRISFWGDGLQFVANNSWNDTFLNIRQFSNDNVPATAITFQIKNEGADDRYSVWANGQFIFDVVVPATTQVADVMEFGGNHIYGFFRVFGSAVQDPFLWHKSSSPWSI